MPKHKPEYKPASNSTAGTWLYKCSLCGHEWYLKPSQPCTGAPKKA